MVHKISFPQAVLFDYDGVLVDSSKIHVQAWIQLLNEQKINAPDSVLLKELKSFTGKTSPEILNTMFNTYNPEIQLNYEQVQALLKKKEDYYLELSLKNLNTFPGAIEGLTWLKSKKVRLAVVSNGKRREIQRTMKQLQITQFFDLILSREDVDHFKPHPLPYLTAINGFQLKAKDCMAIEDSPSGLVAALKADLRTIAVQTSFDSEVLKSPVKDRPDLMPIQICKDLEQAFFWLKQL